MRNRPTSVRPTTSHLSDLADSRLRLLTTGSEALGNPSDCAPRRLPMCPSHVALRLVSSISGRSGPLRVELTFRPKAISVLLIVCLTHDAQCRSYLFPSIVHPIASPLVPTCSQTLLCLLVELAGSSLPTVVRSSIQDKVTASNMGGTPLDGLHISRLFIRADPTAYARM